MASLAASGAEAHVYDDCDVARCRVEIGGGEGHSEPQIVPGAAILWRFYRWKGLLKQRLAARPITTVHKGSLGISPVNSFHEASTLGCRLIRILDGGI